MFFAVGVVEAERGMNVGPGHGALASIGEHELAAVGQGFGLWRAVEAIVVVVGIRPGSEAFGRNVIGAGGERALSVLDNLMIGCQLIDVVLVRREIGRTEFGGILEGNGRRKNVMAVG